MNTKAKYVEDIDAAGNVPGAWSFYSTAEVEQAGIIFICPCGCGRQGSLPINSDEVRRNWTWNGSIKDPTLTPSVLFNTFTGDRTVEHWHGWLRNGHWISV